MGDCCCLKPMIVAEYQTDPTVNGGQATDGQGGNWQVYPLNTLTTNDYQIASMVNNNILLPAGTYRIINGTAIFMNWKLAILRVIRTDTGAMLTDAIEVYQDGVTGYRLPQVIPTEFTLQSATQIQLQYIVALADGTSGQNDLGGSVTEDTSLPMNRYGFLHIQRVSAFNT